MKLTDFNTVVDTYKKNFLIRKKRFKDLKTQESVEKRKREKTELKLASLLNVLAVVLQTNLNHQRVIF